MESMLELRLSGADGRGTVVELPIVHRQGKGRTNTKTRFESMSINPVVQHGDTLYRFRMPHAVSMLDKNLHIVVKSGVTKVREEINYKIDDILAYKKIMLEVGEGDVDQNILDPSHLLSSDKTLDAFALELGMSTHYLIFIAGQWFISFSNFFKFFSEDYQGKNISDVTKAVKSITPQIFKRS